MRLPDPAGSHSSVIVKLLILGPVTRSGSVLATSSPFVIGRSRLPPFPLSTPLRNHFLRTAASPKCRPAGQIGSPPRVQSCVCRGPVAAAPTSPPGGAEPKVNVAAVTGHAPMARHCFIVLLADEPLDQEAATLEGKRKGQEREANRGPSRIRTGEGRLGNPGTP